MAAALAKMYLPPLPPPVEPRSTTPQRPRPKLSTQTPAMKTPQKRQPMRTSLREEIMLATINQEKPPDFNTRMGFDLKRIVEDQVNIKCHRIPPVPASSNIVEKGSHRFWILIWLNLGIIDMVEATKFVLIIQG
jgi:hypothetical protein